MDGEEVGIDDTFSNGLKFPGDPSGSVEEVAGCTCVVSISGQASAEPTPTPQPTEPSLDQQMTDISGELERFDLGESRWDGTVEVTDADGAVGRFEWDEGITLDPWLFSAECPEPVRLNTMLHEIVHGYSPGVTKAALGENRALEEGVVEGFTRLIRDDVYGGLGRTGIDWFEADSGSAYMTWVNRLWSTADTIGMEAKDFFHQLLMTPLDQRFETLLGWVKEADLTTDARNRLMERMWDDLFA
jgi:hypothetical protein